MALEFVGALAAVPIADGVRSQFAAHRAVRGIAIPIERMTGRRIEDLPANAVLDHKAARHQKHQQRDTDQGTP